MTNLPIIHTGLSSLFEGYEEIWEKDGKWHDGQSVLFQVIRNLQDNSLEPYMTPDDQGNATGYVSVQLPLPSIKEPFGEPMNIFWKVPSDLRPLFLERCTMVIAQRDPVELTRIMDKFKGLPVDVATYHKMKAALMEHERQVEISGGRPLWQIAMNKFGMLGRMRLS
jgi:hypothetical protein